MGAIGAINPKSIYEILANAPKINHGGASLVSEKEIPMRKAYSKKYKSRNILVNNTSFSFNSEGFCELSDIGNARLDFELLLKKNHVDEVLDDDTEFSVEGQREEDTREGIDEAILEAEEEAEELEEGIDEALLAAEEDLEEETLDEKEPFEALIDEEPAYSDESKVDSED